MNFMKDFYPVVKTLLAQKSSFTEYETKLIFFLQQAINQIEKDTKEMHIACELLDLQRKLIQDAGVIDKLNPPRLAVTQTHLAALDNEIKKMRPDITIGNVIRPNFGKK